MAPFSLTFCLPVTSAVNLGKQFGPRSGLTNRRAWSGSKLFDNLMVFLKEFFQKVYFEKNNSRRQKSTKNYPVCNELRYFLWCRINLQGWSYLVSKVDTVKIINFSDARKLCWNLPKIQTKSPNLGVFHQKDEKLEIANSEDPDQTAPVGAVWSGSALFALDQSVRELRVITVFYLLHWFYSFNKDYNDWST